MSQAPVRLWTVGHSNRTILELLAILASVPIAYVVDVRTLPRSRRYPQFDRDALAWELERVGIVYRHAPELGGLRKPRTDSVNTALRRDGFRGYADHMQTAEFRAGVGRLIGEASGSTTTVLCAEASPEHCHRSLLADALIARDVQVVHLLAQDPGQPHRLGALARIAGETVTYPGLL